MVSDLELSSEYKEQVVMAIDAGILSMNDVSKQLEQGLQGNLVELVSATFLSDPVVPSKPASSLDCFICGHWIAREEEQSAKERCENQSRFFKELQSISDGDGSENIKGVTITFVKNVHGYS